MNDSETLLSVIIKKKVDIVAVENSKCYTDYNNLVKTYLDENRYRYLTREEFDRIKERITYER